MTRTALIVAHGSPSDPDPQEAALTELAARVAARLPGWRIGGATLAKEGAFDAAVADLGAPWIYPYFMARGYFTKKVLAERAAPLGLRVLEPFGTEASLIASAAQALRRTLSEKGWDAAQTTLLIAAHGSAVSRTSAESARDFAAALNGVLGFAEARAGYVEEPPFLRDQAEGLGQAICLPQFALNAGHMLEDVPEALSAAGFEGPVLPAFIDWPETPELIARSLEQQAALA
ncbi:cobalamin biosynthesis protein CbiX [Salipiger sp. PrR002]|uniref:cobalamin biosynthesis protein CbiX n=1 Tax=Salipiger sp. PrR002 TaxID=2706489 RepID=UPI0013BA7B30|nr:cobalamin biosynthesis protein CbiX [Salipiger sp. PrR002]NDV99701.1 cobalamin biosynthesis protein CbiX [Salipiger sp. PrR002]NDW56701.1 cobalamin biosynthesis protein CbiX [Salipiger sp. PrR004]